MRQSFLTLSLILSLFLQTTSFAAITLDVRTVSSSFPSSHTVATGSNLGMVACVIWFGSSDRNVSTMTYNGDAMTKAVGIHRNIGSYFITQEIWYIVNPDTGAHSFDFTLDGAVDGRAAGIYSLFGFKQTSPLDSSNTTSSDTSTQSSPLTTSILTIADQCWIFDGIVTDGSPTLTGVGADQVRVSSDQDTYKANVAIGSNSMSWTFTGTGHFAHAVAAFKPAVSAITDFGDFLDVA